MQYATYWEQHPFTNTVVVMLGCLEQISHALILAVTVGIPLAPVQEWHVRCVGEVVCMLVLTGWSFPGKVAALDPTA